MRQARVEERELVEAGGHVLVHVGPLEARARVEAAPARMGIGMDTGMGMGMDMDVDWAWGCRQPGYVHRAAAHPRRTSSRGEAIGYRR